MTEEEIHEICEKYKIENYNINSDMTVDVDSNVNLSDKYLTYLPLKFNKVSGDFYCYRNKLSTLEGCPNYVGKIFNCDENMLTTLKYCPTYVGRSFWCTHNRITTLQHLPINFYFGVNFFYRNNNTIEAKEYSKIFFGTVNGKIITGNTVIDDFLNDNKNPPKKDLPRLLSELRKIQL